jgi:hypothetical protein
MRKFMRLVAIAALLCVPSVSFGKFSDGYDSPNGFGGAFDVAPETAAPAPKPMPSVDDKIKAAAAKTPAPVPAVPLRNAVNSTNSACANGQCGRNR